MEVRVDYGGPNGPGVNLSGVRIEGEYAVMVRDELNAAYPPDSAALEAMAKAAGLVVSQKML